MNIIHVFVCVYRAARHGLKLNGKLRRLTDQEHQLATVEKDAMSCTSQALTGTASDSVKNKSRTRKRKRTKEDNNASIIVPNRKERRVD